MINLRDEILKNQKTYYNGLIAKHQQNVEIYLNQPVGIGEHSDVMAAIDTEINAIAQAHEKIGIIDSYFLGRQMAVEFSEIMAGAAMFYSNRELDVFTKDENSLITMLKDFKKTISSQSNVVYGANRTEFIDYVDQGRFDRLSKLSEKKRKEYLSNAVQGISAAKAIKSWLGGKYKLGSDVKAEKVFITGNKWPKEVADFRISAFGFDDYNSSDIIIKAKGLKYYGISLKKKPKGNSADPTLINKAFDSILNGSGPEGAFDKVK